MPQEFSFLSLHWVLGSSWLLFLNSALRLHFCIFHTYIGFYYNKVIYWTIFAMQNSVERLLSRKQSFQKFFFPDCKIDIYSDISILNQEILLPYNFALLIFYQQVSGHENINNTSSQPSLQPLDPFSVWSIDWDVLISHSTQIIEACLLLLWPTLYYLKWTA